MAIAAILIGIAPGACSTSSTEAELKEELKEAPVQAVAEPGGAQALLWVLCWARAWQGKQTRAKRAAKPAEFRPKKTKMGLTASKMVRRALHSKTASDKNSYASSP